MPSDAPVPTAAVFDPPEAKKRRDRLVDSIARRGSAWDGARWNDGVLAAMREVPRHLFVPQANLDDAYRDAPYPIGLGQTISQPTVVAMMTQALELKGDEKILEIGTGSGYQAAVLGKLAKKVYTIELHAELAMEAKEKLAKAGFSNVVVRAGDGYKGWPEEAPFDRVIVTAAPDQLPKALVDQLAEGGVLVAPVGPEGLPQRLVRYRKHAGKLDEEDLGGVMFVPMVKGDGGTP
jgi:protein-L-isoaspartate(D-aspartate) O-methyltransferase